MKQIIVDNQITNYYIDEYGNCLNSNTNKYLKGQISNSGYLNYNLTLNNGTKKRFYAHRLVAIAYIPNPDQKNEVNHKDGNKLNNYIDNLEWMTSSENQKYKTILGINCIPVYYFDKNKNLLGKFNSCRMAAETLNISETLIRQEYKKKVKILTKGYYWSDSDDNNFSVKNYMNLGISKKVGKYDPNTGELLDIYNSTKQAALSVGSSHGSHIGECCRGKGKTYKGYIWKYVEE